MEPGVPAAGTGDVVEFVAAATGRLDALAAAQLPGVSRARVQRLIERGRVTVNGLPTRKATTIVPGDHIAIALETTEHAAPEPGVEVPVLFEDASLAAIDKPAGLAVHGAPGDMGPTVAGWWLTRLGEAARAFHVERPGIVHRLDKETSGVLVLAKTPRAQVVLSRAFEERTAKKTYLAVVEGTPARAEAVVEAPIARDPRDRMRMAVTARGRAARTVYRVVASDGQRSLLEVRPESGRTHQIRVHLAAVGTPVALDALYGRGKPGGRQLLHALALEIPHPDGGRLTVAAPPPPDLLETIRAIAGEAVASRYVAVPPPTLDQGDVS